MWHSEEVKNLPTGMVKLLEKYHLAASITIPPHELTNYAGPKYFVPFVLESSKENAQAGGLHTAPLHFIFPKIKHLPPGVFANFIVGLVESKNETFRINFNSKLFCDQITCWFENSERDKVVLSATMASICVTVERLKPSENEYKTSNFWLTCQNILTSLTTQLEMLGTSFGPIKLAFCCTCKSSHGGLPHYVKISTDTKSTCNILRCEEDSDYTLNGDEQLWLKMAVTRHDEGKNFISVIKMLAVSLKPEDQKRLTEALEVPLYVQNTNFIFKMSGWADAAGADAHKHLVYHLNRLGLREVADGIDMGRDKKIDQHHGK